MLSADDSHRLTGIAPGTEGGAVLPRFWSNDEWRGGADHSLTFDGAGPWVDMPTIPPGAVAMGAPGPPAIGRAAAPRGLTVRSARGGSPRTAPS